MKEASCNKVQESAVTRSLLRSVKRDFKRLESCLNEDWGAGGKRADYESANERQATEERFKEAGAEPSIEQFQAPSDAPESSRQSEGFAARRVRESPAYYFRSERQWLVWQCSIAVRAINQALRARPEYEPEVQGCENVYSALQSTYRQMRLRFEAISVSYANHQSIEACKKYFAAIGEALYFLCMSQQVSSQAYRFYEINYYSKRMGARLQAGLTTLQQWANHWQNSYFGDDLTIIQEKIETTIQISRKVKKISYRAAKSCQVNYLRRSNKRIGRRLTRLYSSYYEATCLLNQLKCVEIECGFFTQVSSRLNRAGFFVAAALRAQMAISISKEEKYSLSQLTTIWRQQFTYLLEAEEEIRRWQQRQLCAPACDCVEIFGELQNCVSEALKSAAVLEAEPTNLEAMRNQRGVVDQFEAKVAELAAKAGELKGLHRRVFDQFFWELVKIRLVLRSGGARKDAPRSAAPPRKIFTAWKTLEAAASGGQPIGNDEQKRAALELSRGLRSWFRRLASRIGQPQTATGQGPAAAQAYAQPASPATGRCSPANVQTVLQQTTKLLGEIKVAASMEEPRQEMIAKLQLQESWLANYAVPGKVAIEMVAEHSLAQWQGIYLALTMIAAYATDEAAGKRCAAQLAEQDARMKMALGLAAIVQ